MEAMIGKVRRLRGWAADTFLQPASVTLVSRPGGQRPVDLPAACPGEATG